MSGTGCEECRALEGHHVECLHFGECSGCGRQLKAEPNAMCPRVAHWQAWHETHVTLTPKEAIFVLDLLHKDRHEWPINQHFGLEREAYDVGQALLARLESIPPIPSEMAKIMAAAKKRNT